MRVSAGILILTAVLSLNLALAQSPDSFIVTNDSAPPGGMATISINLRNTQFSVGGFSARFVLADSIVASFAEILRGADVGQFEYFETHVTAGTCRFVGLANAPGGDDPSPLAVGVHELAIVHIMIDEDAPWGFIDSIFFANDEIPPDRDNSISDSTGYINEVPSLGPGWVLFDIIIGVDDAPAGLPSKISLAQNYPNPFNIKTMISFELPSHSDEVSLRIYDLVGRQIRTFDWGGLEAGTHNVIWDGADAMGNTVSSGIYFYRLEVDSHPAETMKMTLLK